MSRRRVRSPAYRLRRAQRHIHRLVQGALADTPLTDEQKRLRQSPTINLTYRVRA